MDPTQTLADRFSEAAEWPQVVRVYLGHFLGGFLTELVARELSALARSQNHSVVSGVNQYTLTPVSQAHLEYSIRIMTPFSARPHTIKWLGMRQIIGMKGKGAVTIRKLRAPPSSRIENFEAGVALETVGREVLTSGGFVIATDTSELLDIESVGEPCVLEVLTFKADASPTIWTFDDKLVSVYAEQSLPVLSRFRNVFRLAAAMGRELPDDICRSALQSGNARLALAALEALLGEGRPEAFAALHDAIRSENDELRRGAERLLSLIANAREAVDAA